MIPGFSLRVWGLFLACGIFRVCFCMFYIKIKTDNLTIDICIDIDRRGTRLHKGRQVNRCIERGRGQRGAKCIYIVLPNYV